MNNKIQGQREDYGGTQYTVISNSMPWWIGQGFCLPMSKHPGFLIVTLIALIIRVPWVKGYNKPPFNPWNSNNKRN